MEQEIIDKYLEGKSISSLLKEYPTYNRRTLTKVLTDNHITIRGGRKKKTFSDEQVEEIKKMIKEGAFLKEIAAYFNIDTETMKRRLDELGLAITNTNRVNRRIKSDYFSSIDSPEKAYWIGFLYTDGSVDHYRKTGRIRLQLQEQDKEILEKFKEDLQIDSKIIYDIRPNSTCCSVEFVDELIFNDLSKFDIIPNKTYESHNLPYTKIPQEFLPAFALGLFDGDGGLFCSEDFSKDVTLSYTAYYETEVIDFINLITNIAKLENKKSPFYTSAWHAQWRGRQQVIKILDSLYSSCPRHLKRKYDKYIALKNSLK